MTSNKKDYALTNIERFLFGLFMFFYGMFFHSLQSDDSTQNSVSDCPKPAIVHTISKTTQKPSKYLVNRYHDVKL